MSFKRALISVSDKNGLPELASILVKAGIEIVSTGGTSKVLKSEGLPVTAINTVTGYQEILDGRVKTLHPAVHGGILARHNDPEHLNQLNELDIQLFDLVIVNLYPFRQTLENHPDDPELIIENIDIGGPCLIRAAAKNHRHCLVVTDPSDYSILADLISENLPVEETFRRHLAFKAFSHTCQYDYLIQSWLGKSLPPDIHNSSLPDTFVTLLEKKEELRYGENPHQHAAVYGIPGESDDGLLGYTQHSGKALSFNNLLDLNAAWDIAMSFNTPAVSVIKHQNPCGAATDPSLKIACDNALAGDPQSAFGGIVALNKPVDPDTAMTLHKTHFLEVIAAPGFDEESLKILRKKKNRRIIELKQEQSGKQKLDIRLFHNGALIQTLDNQSEDATTFQIATKVKPDDDQWQDLLFAWQVCRFVKSNAIVFARDRSLIGVGAGQMSRVDSVKIAAEKAGDRIAGGVMASDAFFPFRDGIDFAVKAGVRAVIQPGGSKGDESVIEACNEAGIAMIFTGIRHFKH